MEKRIDPKLITVLNEPPIVGATIEEHQLPGKTAGLFFRAAEFLAELGKYPRMDVMTFSCFEPAFGPRVMRLIHNKAIQVQLHNVGQIRVAANVHAKIYLCYPPKGEVVAYIGSANWAPRGEFFEVMVRCTKEQSSHLLHFFDNIWDKLAPQTVNS